VACSCAGRVPASAAESAFIKHGRVPQTVIPLQHLESMSTRFEGMSVGDANPDSASASASVATVRSADVGVGTGKGAGDSAAASAPVATVRSAGAGVVAKKPCTSPESCRDAAMEELG
jgi:hypothetical protein